MSWKLTASIRVLPQSLRKTWNTLQSWRSRFGAPLQLRLLKLRRFLGFHKLQTWLTAGGIGTVALFLVDSPGRLTALCSVPGVHAGCRWVGGVGNVPTAPEEKAFRDALSRVKRSGECRSLEDFKGKYWKSSYIPYVDSVLNGKRPYTVAHRFPETIQSQELETEYDTRTLFASDAAAQPEMARRADAEARTYCDGKASMDRELSVRSARPIDVVTQCDGTPPKRVCIAHLKAHCDMRRTTTTSAYRCVAGDAP